MTVSVPRFAIKLAGREYSRWNLLITQSKYTSTLTSKSSSKSKKSAKSWRKAAELNGSACADPGTQGQLPTMGGAFRNWRRTAESNGHPCGAPAFRAGRDPHPRALQTDLGRYARDGRGRRNRTPIPKERRYSRPVADHPPAPAVEHRVRIELTMSCSAGSRFAN